VGFAVGIGMIDPTVGVFIAVVPFLKMLNASCSPKSSRVVGQIVEGMAKPVHGDSQGLFASLVPEPAPTKSRSAREGDRRRHSGRQGA
jgi:hypothetical protein